MKETKKQWPEIWATLRDAFATPRNRRNVEQRHLTTDGRFNIRMGMCNAISKMGLNKKQTTNVFRHLRYYFNSQNRYWFPCTNKGDLKRAEFCDFMAGIPHDDFEDFIGEGA